MAEAPTSPVGIVNPTDAEALEAQLRGKMFDLESYLSLLWDGLFGMDGCFGRRKEWRLS
jgi:hypothetical protein